MTGHPTPTAEPIAAAWAALDRRFGVQSRAFGDYADDGPRDAVGVFLASHHDADGSPHLPVVALRADLPPAEALEILSQLDRALDRTDLRGAALPPTAFGPALWLVPTVHRFGRGSRRYW